MTPGGALAATVTKAYGPDLEDTWRRLEGAGFDVDEDPRYWRRLAWVRLEDQASPVVVVATHAAAQHFGRDCLLATTPEATLTQVVAEFERLARVARREAWRARKDNRP